MSNLATVAQSAARNVAASGLLVLRSRDLRRRAASPVSARALLRRTRADGARTSATTVRSRRATTRRRSSATPTASSSSRTSAAIGRRSCCNGRGNAPQHRLPAAPLDLRPQGRAPRRAAFRRQPVPRSAPLAAARTGTGCCSTASATSPPTSRASAPSACFDFSDHVLDRVEINECNYNWKTFIEVYLEDYHVEPFHPGLGQFVTCDDLRWEFGDWYSVQTVGVQQRARQARARAKYARWHEAVLDYLPRRDPAARRDLADLLPEHHGRVVSARAHRQHADPARPSTGRPTSSSSTIPRRSRCSSANSSKPSRRRTWRRRARTTRSPSAWTPAATRSTRQGRSEDGPVPVADGRRHAALPRVPPARARAHLAHCAEVAMTLTVGRPMFTTLISTAELARARCATIRRS